MVLLHYGHLKDLSQIDHDGAQDSKWECTSESETCCKQTTEDGDSQVQVYKHVLHLRCATESSRTWQRSVVAANFV